MFITNQHLQTKVCFFYKSEWHYVSLFSEKFVEIHINIFKNPAQCEADGVLNFWIMY